jgi:myo-inositol-1(or 4)-monophosphatase
MSDPLTFAVKLALKTGNLLRTFFNPAGISASMKPDRTVVTEADLAADKLISSAILEHYPQDEIISEESFHPIKITDSPTWIVDPLDGTTNFSLGLAIWGVSIALTVKGIPELGALYFPMLNELYTARRGEGAFMNHKPIHVRPPDPAHPMSFFACCSRTFQYYEVSIPYKSRILGSAAYSYCMVARGSALLGLDATPKIWDLAAIWILIEEAGGMIAPLEGQSPFPVSPDLDYRAKSYPMLASATREVFLMGKKKIQRKSKFTFIVQEPAQ